VTFSFLPADIVDADPELRLPAPIDVQVLGGNREASGAVAPRCSPA
jgi:hypothetical protein